MTKGTLNSVTDPKGVKTGYTYDWKGTLLTTSVSATINGVTQKLSNTYAYDQDKLSSVSHNGINYSFAYDEFGRNTQNKVGNQILITNEYDAQNRLKKSNYGNGHTVEPVYDSLDRVTSKKYNGLTEFSWQYARDNKVTQYTNEITGITENYVYNERGQLSKIADSNRNLLLYSYNEKRQLSALQATYNDETKTASYAYDNLNRMTSLNIATSPSVTWSYDSLSRMNKEEISHNGTANSLWKTEYSYLPGTLSTQAGSTSGRIGQVSLSKNRDGEVKYSRNIGYTYDQNGNIATILENGVVKATYTYDELNQLVREDNGYLNKSITYTYDKGGNLLNKKEYAYTTGTLGATSNIITYSYGDANWPDKMTEFNGQAVTYDAIGNPLSYGGHTYTWEHGRQLKSLSGNGKNSSYQYDADGMRKKKTVDGVTTTYYYQGGALLYQNNGTDAIWFFYGNGGKLSAMRINGGVYYYYYNAQGDVLGLINTSGDIYCQYTYDSWGKLVSIKDASGNDKTNDLSFYGTKNPFRYRGYYYDTETGMYYLQSRYYMPEWGRFLNADGYFSTGGSPESKNMFAYGLNNPVMMSDPTGHTSVFWFCDYYMGKGNYSCSTVGNQICIGFGGHVEYTPLDINHWQFIHYFTEFDPSRHLAPKSNVESKKKTFASQTYLQAVKVSASSNIPVATIFAQACIESSYGTHRNYLDGNNVFNIKGIGSAGSIRMEDAIEWDNGTMYYEDSLFKAYKNVDESYDDYANLLNNRYRSYLGGDSSAYGWAMALQTGGYATQPNYANYLMSVSSFWGL